MTADQAERLRVDLDCPIDGQECGTSILCPFDSAKCEHKATIEEIIARASAEHAAARASERPFSVVVLRACFPPFAWIADSWNSRPAGARMWQPWKWLIKGKGKG